MPKNKANFLPKHHRSAIIDEIMNDPGMSNALENLAEKSTNSLPSLQAQARDILKEMISAHDPKCVRLSRWAVTLVQKLFFSNIELKGNLTQLRSSNRPNLYIPVHRSHMDYLFLSFVLFQQKLPPPIIAAGINLSFFPMGPIFRRLGAFFIRRRISGNATYKICLEHYLQWLVKKKQHIECYPEGGRSRDGMIRKPQSGLIQLLLQAMALEKQPFDIVPVTIGYDFIPDAQGFADEEMGQDKIKESAWTMLKSIFHIRQYGAIYFHILPAITNHGLDDPMQIKESAQSLLDQVFDTMAGHMPITAVQVLSCALLSMHEEVPEEQIFEQALAIRAELSPYHQQFCQSLNDLERRFPVLIEQMIRNKWLIRIAPYRYKIARKQRIQMNYHRHSILHYFLPSYFARSSRPAIVRKLWLDYFPYLDPRWLDPLDNFDPTYAWPGLETMVNDILEPYTQTSSEPTHAERSAHPRPENITPFKQQRAKNWLEHQDSDMLRQIYNIN